MNSGMLHDFYLVQVVKNDIGHPVRQEEEATASDVAVHPLLLLRVLRSRAETEESFLSHVMNSASSYLVCFLSRDTINEQP